MLGEPCGGFRVPAPQLGHHTAVEIRTLGGAFHCVHFISCARKPFFLARFVTLRSHLTISGFHRSSKADAKLEGRTKRQCKRIEKRHWNLIAHLFFWAS